MEIKQEHFPADAHAVHAHSFGDDGETPCCHRCAHLLAMAYRRARDQVMRVCERESHSHGGPHAAHGVGAARQARRMSVASVYGGVGGLKARGNHGRDVQGRTLPTPGEGGDGIRRILMDLGI
ncbi:hypothetical protein HK101_002801 [Irineochytrium annulatum]|nr:hypothetical protein HK101_002801 [Irineochytrium annulatum]